MTLAEDVASLQERLRDAEKQRARAEGARDSAKQTYDDALAALRAEFGVDTVEEAAALMHRLRDDLARIVTDLTVQLDKIGV